MIWALTENGTAAAETALCSACSADRPFPRDPAVTYDGCDPVDATENTEVACVVCGAIG